MSKKDDAYRRAAQMRLYDYVRDHENEGAPIVRLGEWPRVQETEDGAFVDALIWVPASEMKALL